MSKENIIKIYVYFCECGKEEEFREKLKCKFVCKSCLDKMVYKDVSYVKTTPSPKSYFGKLA